MKLVKTVKNFHRKNETGKIRKKVKKNRIFSKTAPEIGYRTTVTDEKKNLNGKLIRDFMKNVLSNSKKT